MRDLQLNKALELLDAVIYSTTKKNTYVDPVLHEEIMEFLDDIYSEESLLNEAFSKAIYGELKDYETMSTIEIPIADNPEVKEITIKVINKLSDRIYEASYYYNGDDLQIVNKFKEVI